ncbi:helix-turn-helix domain-containing protein [Massilia phyllosphaerae]|uniref:helix-turn-helix domain-containing protein n=1 Tax=Massilia phyllosphaerae TaxID=3106034 RepID=UPI0035C8F685
MSTLSMQLPCYTIQDAGTLLSYSRSTINRLVRDGVLSKFSMGANSVRITGDSLRAFLSKQMAGSQMGS